MYDQEYMLQSPLAWDPQNQPCELKLSTLIPKQAISMRYLGVLTESELVKNV